MAFKACWSCGVQGPCSTKCACAKCVDPKGYDAWRNNYPEQYDDWLRSQFVCPQIETYDRSRRKMGCHCPFEPCSDCSYCDIEREDPVNENWARMQSRLDGWDADYETRMAFWAAMDKDG